MPSVVSYSPLLSSSHHHPFRAAGDRVAFRRSFVTPSLPFTPPSRRLWAPFGSVPPPPVAFRLLPYGVNGKGVNDMRTTEPETR